MLRRRAGPGASQMIDSAKLYELSLTVGTSIRLETNCERFLASLIRLKELTAASVWLRHDLLTGNDPAYGEGQEASARGGLDQKRGGGQETGTRGGFA